MTPRQKRMVAVAAIVIGVGAATVVAPRAFQENLSYFYSPSQIAAGEAPDGRAFRVGGLVIAGSVERTPGDLEVRFAVTDNAKTVPVSYSGLLPDLFREGQGIIAHGKLDERGIFVADEVLAKHDENYMPPEVKATLKPHAQAQEAVQAAEAAPAGGGQGGAP
jgi:cytochrome c-type biogenesis protein CcmE